MPLSLTATALTLLPNLSFVNGFLCRKNIQTWSNTLEKPSFNPPGWLFGPVWASLYTSMGYASYLIYRDGTGDARKIALAAYGTHLGLNWIWPQLYFNLQKLGLSTIELGMQWVALVGTIFTFYPINKTASYLLLPTLAWISFASLISISIWQKNKNRSKKN